MKAKNINTTNNIEKDANINIDNNDTPIDNKTEKLYLVLINTPGIFAVLIKLFTRLKYIHIVLAMDEELKYAYSFGRRKPSVPIISGFEHERMEKVIEHYPNAQCIVSEIECTKEQKKQVWGRIKYYQKNAKKYKYTVLGLPFLVAGRPFHQKRHYACSQFVGRTLEDYGIRKFDKHYSLLTARDFYEMPDKKILYVGTIEGYLDKCNGYKKYIQ